MEIAKDKSLSTAAAELRRRAEERLGESRGTAPSPGSAKESLKLLHELQVHRIELEMQNEELCRARDEAAMLLEKYTDLCEFAPVGYFTLDRKGIIRTVNLTAAGLIGIERSQLIGRHFEHFVPDVARPAFAAFLKKVFTSLVKETSEVSFQKHGDSRLIVQIEAVAAASGQECRIALIDITERKRAAEALLEVEEAAEEARLKVEEALVEALRKVDGTAGEYLKWEMLAEEEFKEVEEATEVARLKVEAALEDARLKVEKSAGAPPIKKAAEVTRLKVEEAAEVARLKVVKSAEVARLVVIDIAKKLRKEKELSEVIRREKAVAEAATIAKSQFLANMSHELRTPMTGVLGMLDLALSGNLETEQREFISMAHTSALSLVKILNDILDLTKIEAGKFSIEAKPFLIRKCVESTVEILAPAARSKRIDLDFTTADDVPETLVGDQTRLSQLLTNLAGNAVKFTEKGRVTLRVAAGGRTPGGKREVIFTVTDTGIGIPDDKKHLLFRVFSQVDESHSRSYGGTGLGLAICREIVELMGGRIAFTSEEGKGSTFFCTIPFGVAESEQGPGLASGITAPSAAAPQAEEITKARLLVAEDDPIIRRVLGSMLKMSKYEVAFAENGQEVVEMWENGNYDLILMDIQMPRMNGFEATASIREKERTRGGNIPIVAMTAHAQKKDENKCLAAGMDAYISKPVDFKECLQLIGKTLNTPTSCD